MPFAEARPFKCLFRITSLYLIQTAVLLFGVVGILCGLMFGQFVCQKFQRAFFVGMLAAFAFDAHRNTAGFVCGADGRLCFIDVLSAFAA